MVKKEKTRFLEGLKQFTRINAELFAPVPQLLRASKKTRRQFRREKDKLVLDFFIEADKVKPDIFEEKFFKKFADRFKALRERFIMKAQTEKARKMGKMQDVI